MTDSNSIKATLSGLGASTLSVLGICCGGGACVAACGAVCAAPLASLLGISTAGFSLWTGKLLPLFTAISAVAFTLAYVSIYRSEKAAADCCEPSSTKAAPVRSNRWVKTAFWVGLILTLGFYTQTMVKQNGGPSASAYACSSTESCSPAACVKAGKSSSCSTPQKEKDERY